MKKKKITTISPNGLVITQWVGPSHPAYHGQEFTFLANKSRGVEGRGAVVLVQGER